MQQQRMLNVTSPSFVPTDLFKQPRATWRATGITSACILVLSFSGYAQPLMGQVPGGTKSGHSSNVAGALPGPGARLDGQLAMEMLEEVCRLGPRISGSAAMQEQQKLLQEHFGKLGAAVGWQPFPGVHPVHQTRVELRNLLVQFHPDRPIRILIACHYDTRPFPDRDPVNPTGVFLGANDGASGVGLLCELGTHLPHLDSEFGVDLVFFDAEEFVYQNGRDEYFLGSTWFARQYVNNAPSWRYAAGVLVDMVGDRELDIFLEKNSWKYARELTRQIWQVAEREGVTEFVARTRHEVRDDHLPLNTIARIPTCDIIDFDYPNPSSKPLNKYWHTEEDTPDKCSAESLAKVGNVLLAWLREVKVPR